MKKIIGTFISSFIVLTISLSSNNKMTTNKDLFLNINDNLFLLDSSNMSSNQVLAEINNLSNVNEDMKKEIEELKTKIEKLRNRSSLDNVFPVGSIYSTTKYKTVEEVEENLGGKWIIYNDGKVLRGTNDKSGETNGTSETVSLTVENLPSHNHSFTPAGSVSTPTFTGTKANTGNQSANLSGSFAGTNANTGANSANHTHSGTTASAGAHTHYTNTTNINMQYLGGSAYYGYGIYTAKGDTTSTDGAHTHTFTTGNQSANHTHNYTPSGTIALSGNHTHSYTAKGSVSTPTFTGTAGTTGTTGSNVSFSIIDPYITVHMYKRIG